MHAACSTATISSAVNQNAKHKIQFSDCLIKSNSYNNKHYIYIYIVCIYIFCIILHFPLWGGKQINWRSGEAVDIKKSAFRLCHKKRKRLTERLIGEEGRQKGRWKVVGAGTWSGISATCICATGMWHQLRQVFGDAFCGFLHDLVNSIKHDWLTD